MPCIVGIDVNEEARWAEDPDAPLGAQLGMGSTNFRAMTEAFLHHGLQPVPLCLANGNDPTHFPRDTERQGRQIDMILTRQVNLEPFVIDADRRFTVGSDHALLLGDATFSTKRKQPWSTDSRPLWTVAQLPDYPIIDWDDVEKLATRCTN